MTLVITRDDVYNNVQRRKQKRQLKMKCCVNDAFTQVYDLRVGSGLESVAQAQTHLV